MSHQFIAYCSIAVTLLDLQGHVKKMRQRCVNFRSGRFSHEPFLQYRIVLKSYGKIENCVPIMDVVFLNFNFS